MLRPARLAALLKVPVVKIQSELFVKSSGRLFLQADNEFYAFLAFKQAMIPYKLAQDYTLTMYGKQLPPFVDVHSAKVGRFGLTSSRSKYLVATFLGHFNHGKTTLLDSLVDNISIQTQVNASKETKISLQRRNYVDQEKYGITQEVRTESICLSNSTFATLVDTPGQEIFYRMRNIGAEVSDVVVLLLSAVDGICEQTKESIGLAETLGVPVIVALNKVDLLSGFSPSMDTNGLLALPKIQELIEECNQYVALEKATFIPISAKNKINLDTLKQALASTTHHQRSLGRQNEIVPHYSLLSGRGFVLNLVHAHGTSPLLHLILTEGTINVGDYFQAGGWGGKVIRVIIKDRTQHASSDHQVILGMAVTIVPSYFDDLDEPRPSTELIHFFSSSHDSPNVAKEQAMLAKDEIVMTAAWENHQQNEEEIKRFRLRTLFTLDRLSKSSYYFKKLLMQRKAVGGTNITSDRRGREKGRDAAVQSAVEDVPELTSEEAESTVKRVLIVRMKSELDLGTFIDALDDWHEQQEVAGGNMIRLLQTGVGDIAKADIDLAIAAGDIAEVIGYNVGVDKHAKALAKAKSVKVTLYDHMPQLLETMFAGAMEGQ